MEVVFVRASALLRSEMARCIGDWAAGGSDRKKEIAHDMSRGPFRGVRVEPWQWKKGP